MAKTSKGKDGRTHDKGGPKAAGLAHGAAGVAPLQTAPVRDREAAGRALAKRTPLKDHAAWRPSLRQHDPIDLVVESSKGRIEHLVPIRYGRMLANPFAFYRGSASVMAADLSRTPASGVHVQACGDCHAVNFGGFATPERRIVFDINDFDETSPAPWEWDVKRLAASAHVASRHIGGNRSQRLDAARAVEIGRAHV
jgi:hypothetical protein